MELLIELYKISAPSHKEKEMIRYITGKLDAMSIPYEMDRYGNIYSTKGRSESYPCVVAHTDEVHPERSKGYEVVNFRDEIIFGYDSHKKRLTGIGADDKNGIWVCLKCLEEYEHMKCAFFVGEEVGCIGSNRADMAFFDDCRYVLQCDRRGNSDLISSISGVELCSDDFIHDINMSGYGYEIQEGMQTDVATLKKRGLNVSCVNISCGYYNPHSREEYTNIADLKHCLRFVRHIVDTCTDIYKHSYRPARYNRFGRYGYPYYCNGPELEYGFEDDELLYFPHEKPVRAKPDKRDYMVLVDTLTKDLAADSNISVRQLMKIYRKRFPDLTYQDFKNAYKEVLG